MRKVDGTDMKPLLLVLLVAASIAAGVGDIALYRWSKSETHWWLAASCLLWMASITFFGFYLRWTANTFSFAVILAMIVQIIIVMGYDILVLRTKMNTLQWVGMLLGVLAIVIHQLGQRDAP